MSKQLPVLAITPGEPSGIGPEITVRLLDRHRDLRIIAVADSRLLDSTAESIGSAIRTRPWRPGDDVSADRFNCLHVNCPQPVTAGTLDTANAPYVLQTLRDAVGLVQNGLAAGLVTGPVHKGVINASGTPFSGHTEFLARQSGTARVVMMLAAPALRVTLVTTHLPLRRVADAITAEAVEETIRITAQDLRDRFGIAHPRMQVLGLNPHAGEGGHLGAEDDDIIRPVIEVCRAAGMDVTGPVPADTAFTPDRLANCDVVVAMYHDQGLPVLKHAGFGESVNITLGLPFVRTSVDHGTALDIAGRGVADAGSLAHAVETALELCRSPEGQ